MQTLTVKSIALGLLVACGSAHSAFSESSLGKEWSKSGFGSNVAYKCKQASCGGAKSLFKVSRFGGISQVPELGIPTGSNLEAEFRRRPDTRRIFSAVLQQMFKEGGSKVSRFTTSYFATASYVGFNLTGFDAREKAFLVAQLRISDNSALMLGSAAESAALARRNFNVLAPTVKSN